MTKRKEAARPDLSDGEDGLPQVYIDPRHIDADADWRRVDIEAIWASELFPLLDQSTDLQQSLELAINLYRQDNLKVSKPKWRYRDRGERPPFFFTHHDGAEQWLDDAIDRAVAASDFGAMALSALRSVIALAGDVDLRLPASAIKAMQKEAARLERRFYPQFDRTAVSVRPMGSCFWIAPFALDLAMTWRPDLDWRILEGDEHATVVSNEAKLIFDMVLLDPPTDAEPIADPLWFALGDRRSPTLRRVHEWHETKSRIERERQQSAQNSSNGGPRIF